MSGRLFLQISNHKDGLSATSQKQKGPERTLSEPNYPSLLRNLPELNRARRFLTLLFRAKIKTGANLKCEACSHGTFPTRDCGKQA